MHILYPCKYIHIRAYDHIQINTNQIHMFHQVLMVELKRSSVQCTVSIHVHASSKSGRYHKHSQSAKRQAVASSFDLAERHGGRDKGVQVATRL